MNEYKRLIEQLLAIKAGTHENCSQITTPMPHWWCVDIVWGAIDEAVKKLDTAKE